MLSIPKSGWTNVSIAGIEIGPASYIDDVPVMCLQEMIRAISQRLDFCVTFDAEGWEFKVIADDFTAYVILCDSETSLKTFNIGKKELARELLHDIGDHLDDWKCWLFADDVNERDQYKEQLTDLVKDLEVVLN